MTYYAHTADDENGDRLPQDSGKWQLLSEAGQWSSSLGRLTYDLSAATSAFVNDINQ